MYHLIHYYKFSPIEDLHQFWLEQKLRCLALELKGRIYIAAEGINGSLAGSQENISAYKNFLRSLPKFFNTEFKEEECGYIPFYQLKVRIRPEIVSLKTSAINPQQETGEFLEPHQWRWALASEKDYVLLDVRNQYESKIGHFEGAMIPAVENFFDFPQWLEGSGIKRRQKILMYCTGGIRCEKLSSLMKQKGFAEIYQLKGGILNYAQKEDGAHFKGKCFVFDDRLAIPINPKETEPISKCEISGEPCDTYINCANAHCNRLFLCAKEAAIQMDGCCSENCKGSAHKRPLNLDAIYTPYRKWYQYTGEIIPRFNKSAI